VVTFNKNANTYIENNWTLLELDLNERVMATPNRQRPQVQSSNGFKMTSIFDCRKIPISEVPHSLYQRDAFWRLILVCRVLASTSFRLQLDQQAQSIRNVERPLLFLSPNYVIWRCTCCDWKFACSVSLLHIFRVLLLLFRGNLMGTVLDWFLILRSRRSR